ncbi:splicing factor 3A subunit 1-like [Pterocles gutturalis]
MARSGPRVRRWVGEAALRPRRAGAICPSAISCPPLRLPAALARLGLGAAPAGKRPRPPREHRAGRSRAGHAAGAARAPRREQTARRGAKRGSSTSQACGWNYLPSSRGQEYCGQDCQLRSQVQAQVIQETVVPKEPPAEFEFIADPPSISAFDLDVVKLMAQFVARNGRQFLTQLMQREQRNYQFDFLHPQHSLFNYFTKLVEQYTKILIPPKGLLLKLKKEAENPKEVLDQVYYSVEWAKFQERERKEGRGGEGKGACCLRPD